MQKKIRVGCSLLMGLSLAGCGSTKTMVMEPLELQNKVKKLCLEKHKNTTAVNAAMEQCFEEKLHEKLFKEHGFQEGNDIVMKYRFLQFNEGSQFQRWLVGGLGNCGEGSATVEVTFVDNTQNAKEIGKIHTEGKIGSGVFGGALSSVVEGAVEEIAEYVKKHLQKA